MVKGSGNFSRKFFCIKIVGMVLAILFFVNSPGYALWIGQSQLNLFLEVGGGYVSNVYRVNEDFEPAEGDITTVVSPGLSFLYPTWDAPKVKLVANYRAQLQLFSLDGDQVLDANGQLNSAAHNLDGFLYFNFASGLRFNIGYQGSLLSNRPDYPGDTRDYFFIHNPQALLSYAFASGFEVEFGYVGNFRRYDAEKDQVNDFDRNGLDLTFFYKIRPRVSLLAGGNYSDVNRKDPPYSDSIQYTGYGGFRYEVTEKTSAILKVGGMANEFDDSEESQSGWYLSGNLNSSYSERTSWGLNANRGIPQTTLTNGTGLYGSYYFVTSFGANVSHTLASLPNMSFSGSLDFADQDYPREDLERNDKIYGFNLGATYKLYKYLSFRLSYRFTKRDSTIDVYDYVNNGIGLGIRGII